MDHTEKANKIYPSDEQRKAQRKAHLLEALASLSALDVRLTHAYLVMYQNPKGALRRPAEKRSRPRSRDKLDRWQQSLGELIDREDTLLRNILESDRKRK